MSRQPVIIAALAIGSLSAAPLSIASGPAGEIVSIECSKAIAAAMQYFRDEGLEADLPQNDAEVVCVGPVDGVIRIRVQTPDMPPTQKKHYVTVDSESFEVVRYSYSR